MHVSGEYEVKLEPVIVLRKAIRQEYEVRMKSIQIDK